ncbi:MAG: DUF2244 domain-containing protein [Kordiimonadaceae bacterium]|nr:DUF2244 domain-containing protein [Kordiimonadaceae bacterium]
MNEMQERVWFEEYIFPRRSLGRTGFKILMGAIISLSLSIGLFFYSLGAWPITGFFGLDVLLIYWAFKIQYQQGKAVEIIRLSNNTLTITRIDAKGNKSENSFNSYWVNLSMSCPPNVPKNVGETYPQARSHGKGIFFGTYLNQEMRNDLMKSLSQALIDCKNYRPDHN